MASLLTNISCGLGLFDSIMLGPESGLTGLGATFLGVQLLLLAGAIIIRRRLAALLILVFIGMTVCHWS